MVFGRVKRWLERRRERTLPEALSAALRDLSYRFTTRGIEHAVIGGVAMSLHGPPRATVDLDFLIDAAAADQAHEIMQDIGFVALQRTKLFANYSLPPLRVDFLHTQGPQTQGMLKRAVA